MSGIILISTLMGWLTHFMVHSHLQVEFVELYLCCSCWQSWNGGISEGWLFPAMKDVEFLSEQEPHGIFLSMDPCQIIVCAGRVCVWEASEMVQLLDARISQQEAM
ncbi:uncharacterized protein LOC111868867 [Cryptotermes secundus]|uniref:uncharacterized protein LOC111868867 n=1 Tax=Cryptotermes secundus TaxID=105785 RepID=UPI000CD7DA4E|nr:uncharacterized protein LOC111868867 [Cryptotermes secundus]